MLSAWLSLYRARDKHFGAIREPQWRMLLDLAVNGECSVTSLCIASGVPATTALRHIDLLLEAGFVSRREDDADGRRAFIALTAEAESRLALFQRPLNSGEGRPHREDGSPVSPSFHNSGIDRD